MDSGLARTDRLRRAPHVVSLAQGSQTVLLDTRECRYHTLDGVGTRVWQLLNDGPALGAIVETISAEYDAPEDRVDADIGTLISELRSSGLVRVERRALPVIDTGPASSLPPLYASWMEHVLDGPVPDEPHATCQDCAMAKPVGQAASANTTRYDPHVKCCSYLPVLPNYLVGQILSDTSEAGAIGRDSVRERIAGASVATPLGIGMFREYAAIYKHAGPLFGKSEALRCPHFIDENGGSCGIWRHRNSVCATYFCKLGRGAVAKVFWDALLELLGLVERHVAIWCAHEMGLGASALGVAMLRSAATLPAWVHEDGDTWGPWRGREQRFYIETSELVRGLSWDRVVDIGGVDLRASIKNVRKAHAAHMKTELPELLRLGAVSRMQMDSYGTVLSGYSLKDMLVVPTALADVLEHFDGRTPTSAVLERILSETGNTIDAGTLRRLVDFNVLMRPPDLVTTDLGTTVRQLAAEREG
jgi:hypothetical protein